MAESPPCDRPRWVWIVVAAGGLLVLALAVLLGDRWHSYLVEECPACGSRRSEDRYLFGVVREESLVESEAYRAFFEGAHVHDWRHQHSHEFGGPKASSSLKDNWFGQELRRPGVLEFLRKRVAEGALTKEEVRRLCALPRRPTEEDLLDPGTDSGIRKAEALVLEAGVKPDSMWPRPR